jgi:hypothetical protein
LTPVSLSQQPAEKSHSVYNAVLHLEKHEESRWRGELMKPILFVIVLAACLSGAAWAQDADYSGWMKAVSASNTALGKDLAAKTGDAAAADANKLADLFGQVHDYWQKKGTDDAVKFAADAQAGFKQIADLAAAGKFDDASAAAKTASANCAGCHTAHRARAADGTYSMK